jgi:hypothetical protein
VHADDDSRILWTQFILAAALGRCVRVRADGGEAEAVFCYTDTHAGVGRLARRPEPLDRLLAARGEFSDRHFFAAQDDGPAAGSWVLAARVMETASDGRLAWDIDVNDIDPHVIEQAPAYREGSGRVRFWSHDWFQYLRARLSIANLPDFVFIDPPPDDARGPGYAIDAAILLDTLAVPYMVSYPAAACQDSIDQIGRTGLELHRGEAAHGVLLGGGAETATLHILKDLRRLAALLGGECVVRLPRSDDYTI